MDKNYGRAKGWLHMKLRKEVEDVIKNKNTNLDEICELYDRLIKADEGFENVDDLLSQLVVYLGTIDKKIIDEYLEEKKKEEKKNNE